MDQVSILGSIVRQKSLSNYNTFIDVDEAFSHNIYGRIYRFCEVTDMLREAGINTLQLVATNFELQSATRADISQAEFCKEMEPYLNEQYLLENSLQPERVALLTISSVPAVGVSMVILVLNGWKLRVINK